ncbi:MAG: hypothetical protein KDD62_00045 [Bdellovibrionales bacterium]|nr:hypothetical protein [Bdellovibrionales bacterium]
MRYVSIIVLSCLLAACSSSWQHAYDHTIPHFDSKQIQSVLVIAVDERPHVVANPADRNLVGQLKTFGTDKRPIFTTPHATFAEQAGHALCNGFNAQEVQCDYYEALNVPQGETILDQANQHGAQRIVLLEVQQWFVNVFALPTLQYGFSLRIYSKLGEYLAGQNVKGSETLSIAEFLNPAQNASITAPEAFSKILADLMSSQRIQEALRVQG